jgi:hypothetical protein
MNRGVSCSRCGSAESLHVVVLGKPRGRLLVYCPACRQERAAGLAFSQPLSAATAAVLEGLYRDGVTASDPSVAMSIVFGDNVPEGLLERLRQFVSEH